MPPLELPPHPARALVIDTNVALDLLVFNDPRSAPLHALVSTHGWPWLATPAMRDELERVLGYAHIALRVAFYRLTPHAVLHAYDARTRRVAAAPRAPAVCKDADDQKFIDLACAHQALLLSKDKAVLCMRKRLAAHGASAAAAIELIA